MRSYVQKTARDQAGQTLLIAVGLASMLAIALAAIFFSNQLGAFHQTASAQRIKALSVASQGIAYAAQQLSTDLGTWQNALNANFPAACNSGSDIVSPSGGRFKLMCSTGTAGNPDLQPYQVAVTAVASVLAANGTDTPLRAVRAYLSQRTLGVDLASGVHAAAAVQLAAQPTVAGTLDVHWGPIVCLDINSNATSPVPWSLPTLLDTQRYPRKFSVGGILGSTYARAGSAGARGANSDQKEYWAYAPQTDVPLIDESYYIQRAQRATGITPPTVLGTNAPIPPTGCLPALTNTTCGYFGPLGSGVTAVFDGGVTGYTVPAVGLSTAVIYVDGSAQFNKTAIDNGTFIVTGQLTINDATGGTALSLNVPRSAPLEYPYAPTTPVSWPCQGQQGGTCSMGTVQFRGFLYVKGYLMVNKPGWVMAGALLVGDLQAPLGTSGTINIPGPTGPANASMTVYYDDAINHAIQTSPVVGTSIKVEPDLIRDVTGI